MRVAILGMGAIGQHIAHVLDGRAELVAVDRTHAPLRAGEAPVDAAVVTTKTPGTEWAANVALKVLAADGVALTLQNGLGNYEVLADRLGHERVAVGVIYVGAGFRADGTHYATGAGRIQLARPEAEGPGARADSLVELLRAGGTLVEVIDDPWPAVWRKLVANAVMNAPSALLDASYGEILGDPAKTLLCDGLARESARVVTSAGYPVSEQEAMDAWRAIARAMSEHRSSMHADVAGHRRTEVDAINGALVREGDRRGVAAPLNQAMTVLVSALDRD
jgi:2-dehydropantoate 2-reductase